MNEHNGESDIDICVDIKPKFGTFDNFMDLKYFLQKITSKEIDLVIIPELEKDVRKIMKEEKRSDT